jgi:hypothetical protein
VPSQHLRRLLADCLGLGDRWHWAIHPERDNVLQTIAAYSAL